MTRAQVQLAGQVLEAVRASMTAEDLEAVRAVRVVCKPVPDGQDLQRGCGPQHKAAFWGIGRELGVQGLAELPDPRPAEGEIVLFLDNLVPVTEGRLRVALLHEYAHALGWEEDEIRAFGLYLEEGAPDACCAF